MRSRVRFPVLLWEFFLAGKIPVVTMDWVVSRFRLKVPPGISSSCISPLTSSGQRSRAPWASQPQKSAILSPQPGGKPRKFIRTCGGTGRIRRKKNMWRNRKTLEMVQRSPTISTRRLSTRLGVSQTRVWRTLHEDGLYPLHPQRVQNIHPGKSEFCDWLHSNRQLLQLILFTDEVIFTVTESTTHVTRIDGLTTIHMVLWKQNFRVVSLSVCGAT